MALSNVWTMVVGRKSNRWIKIWHNHWFDSTPGRLSWKQSWWPCSRARSTKCDLVDIANDCKLTNAKIILSIYIKYLILHQFATGFKSKTPFNLPKYKLLLSSFQNNCLEWAWPLGMPIKFREWKPPHFLQNIFGRSKILVFEATTPRN